LGLIFSFFFIKQKEQKENPAHLALFPSNFFLGSSNPQQINKFYPAMPCDALSLPKGACRKEPAEGQQINTKNPDITPLCKDIHIKKTII
jgi:hypothetical protein